MEYVNGTIQRIYVDDEVIDGELEATISFSQSVRSSVNKDDGGWEKSLPGTKSWEASGSAEFAKDAANNPFTALFAAWVAGTEVKVDFTTGVTGQKMYTGDCQITSIEQSASAEETVTFSYSFKGNGAVAETVEA